MCMAKKIHDALWDHEQGKSDDPKESYKGKSYNDATPQSERPTRDKKDK